MDVNDSKSIIKAQPFFHLDDSFAQGFCLGDQVRFIQKSDFALARSRAKDFNFSSASTRFGQGLAPDEIRTGLRYIIQGIGESMRQHPTQIDFDVGRLFFSRSSSSFKFTRLKTQQTSLISSTESALVKEPSVIVPVKDLTHVAVSTELKAETVCSSNKQIPLTRQDIVYKQALRRHVSELNMRAASAAQARTAWNTNLESGSRVSATRQYIRRLAEVANLKEVELQIKRKQKINLDTAEGHAFPQFSGWAETPQSVLHANQKAIQKSLDEQVAVSRARKSIAKLAEIVLAKDMRKENCLWIDAERKTAAAQKKKMARSLSDSWDQDVNLHRLSHRIDHFEMAPPETRIPKIE